MMVSFFEVIERRGRIVLRWRVRKIQSHIERMGVMLTASSVFGLPPDEVLTLYRQKDRSEKTSFNLKTRTGGSACVYIIGGPFRDAVSSISFPSSLYVY